LKEGQKLIKNIKRKVLAPILALGCILPTFGTTTSVASAATPELYLTYHQLTSAEAANISGVSSGTYEVCVNIKNNTGFSAFGLRFDTSGFKFCLDSSNAPIFTDDISGYYATTDDGSLYSNSFTFARTSNVTTNGTIFRFYLKKTATTASITSTVTMFTNSSAEVVIPSEKVVENGSTSEFDSYVRGDANGDSSVNSMDSVVILQAIQKNNNAAITESKYNTYHSTWFPKAKTMQQVDVNLDNVINKTDSNEILDYYAKIIAGTTYTGDVGRKIYYIK
jgi:hypothetical protein